MPKTGIRTLLFAGTLVLLATAACPNCPYETKCDGHTLLYCSIGVDQIVGPADEGSVECRAPNGVCLDLDDRTAACVMDSDAVCETDRPTTCEEDLAVMCLEGYLVAQDCVGHGNGCVVIDEVARCAVQPLRTCEPETFEATCDGTARLWCDRGFIVSTDCANFDPPTTCEPFENDYGRGAYCG